jgi:hypothetical protein
VAAAVPTAVVAADRARIGDREEGTGLMRGLAREI